MKNIGLLGGTFDPIHLGHIQLALLAKQKMDLDRVIFIPNYCSPFKTQQNTAPVKDRVHMIKLALEPYPYFIISDIEVREKIVHYTYQTIQYFKKCYPQSKLYFIAGSDILPNLDKWKNFNSIIENVEFIIVPRKNTFSEQYTFILEQYPKSFHILQENILDISSTQIRFSKINSDLKALLPQKVAEYIEVKQLYQ